MHCQADRTGHWTPFSCHTQKAPFWFGMVKRGTLDKAKAGNNFGWFCLPFLYLARFSVSLRLVGFCLSIACSTGLSGRMLSYNQKPARGCPALARLANGPLPLNRLISPCNVPSALPDQSAQLSSACFAQRTIGLPGVSSVPMDSIPPCLCYAVLSRLSSQASLANPNRNVNRTVNRTVFQSVKV